MVTPPLVGDPLFMGNHLLFLDFLYGMSGSHFSGLNTKSGDLLNFKTKNSAAGIDTAYITLCYSAIIQINDSGVAEFS